MTDDINVDALRRKWQTFAVARDLTDSTPDMLQQITDAERAAREIQLSSSAAATITSDSTINSAEQLYANQLASAVKSLSSSSSSTVTTTTNVSSSSTSTSSTSGIINTNTTKLENLVICRVCQGQGIVKKLYNHMVMDRMCEVCDGDGLVDISKLNNNGTSSLSSTVSINTSTSSSKMVSSESNNNVLAKAVNTLHEAIKINDTQIEQLEEQGYLPKTYTNNNENEEDVPPLE